MNKEPLKESDLEMDLVERTLKKFNVLQEDQGTMERIKDSCGERPMFFPIKRRMTVCQPHLRQESIMASLAEKMDKYGYGDDTYLMQLDIIIDESQKQLAYLEETEESLDANDKNYDELVKEMEQLTFKIEEAQLEQMIIYDYLEFHENENSDFLQTSVFE